MFSFFHRTPTLYVDTFVSDSFIYEKIPIVPTYKTFPQWWLDVPVSSKNFVLSKLERKNGDEVFYDTDKNIRNCYGFLELYRKGFVIENWHDVSIRTGKAGYKFYCSYSVPPTEHPKSQIGNGFENYHHMKLISPWLINEKTGTKFIFMPTTWHHENFNNIIIPPGVLDFTIVNACHINILLSNIDKEFILPMGLPLVQLVPLTDKNMKITNHLVTDEEHMKLRVYGNTSLFGWRKTLSLNKRNKKREELKCPFS